MTEAAAGSTKGSRRVAHVGGLQGGRGEGPAAGSRFGDGKSCVVPEGEGESFPTIGLVAALRGLQDLCSPKRD